MKVREHVCPIDRGEFNRQTDVVPAQKIVRDIVDELLVHCADADCEWSGRRDGLLGHLDSMPGTHQLQARRRTAVNHVHEQVARANADLYLAEFDMVNPSPNDIVSLNVGGTYMMTSRKMLCAHPRSKLAALFSRGFSLRKTHDGTVFLDRNGESFAELLKWLRYHDDTIPIQEKAVAEARYWGIKVKEPCCRLPELLYSETLRLVEVALHSKVPVSLPRVRMAGFYFGGLVLTGANFRSSCLRGASFAGASLCKTDFRECDLVDVDFSGAVLDGANFGGATVRRTCFSNASVNGTLLPAKFHCKCESVCPFNSCSDQLE